MDEGLHPCTNPECGEETSRRGNGLCVDCEVERKINRTHAERRAEFPRGMLSDRCVDSMACHWSRFARRYRGGPEQMQRALEEVDEMLLAVQHDRLVEAGFVQLAAHLDRVSRAFTFAKARGQR